MIGEDTQRNKERSSDVSRHKARQIEKKHKDNGR